MPYLILPSRRTRQPQGVVRINPAHWAAPNCDGVVIAGAYVSGVPANPLPLVAGDGGLAYSSASLSTEMTFDKVVSPQSAGLTTVTRLVRYGAQPDGGFGTAFLYPQLSGVQTPISFFVKDAGERFRVNVTTDDDSANYYETTTAYPVGTWQTSAMTWKSGSVPAIYRNANALTLSYNGGALTGY